MGKDSKEGVNFDKSYLVDSTDDFDSGKFLEFPSLENGFYEMAKSGNKMVPAYKEMAFYLNKKGLFCFNDYVFRYNGYFYEEISDYQLEKDIMQLANDVYQKPAHIVNFKRYTKALCQKDKSEFEEPEGLINLQNGVLDIQTGKIYQNGPHFYFRYILPIFFDQKAKCPNFMRFLNDIFQGDQDLIDVTAEIFGYCLLGGEPFLHKAFVLYGHGRNGKSTWEFVLRKLLGEENVSSVSMGLLDKPFSVVNLQGKLANIVGEAPTTKINSEIFKAAVAGDYITAARKGKDEFRLKVNARFIFACNDLPRFYDASTGLNQRLYILPFNRYIEEEKRDPYIHKKLELELSGILNFSIEGAKRVLQRGCLPKVNSILNLQEEYRREADSVYDFYQSRIVFSRHFDYKVYNKDLHQKYKVFCLQKDLRSVDVNTFSKRLRALLKEQGKLDNSVITNVDRKGRYFLYINARDDDFGN